MYTKFRSKPHNERDKLRYIGVDRSITEETGCEDVVWTHLPGDRVQCRAPVNTAVNLRVHEWLCSVALVS
jgi:hypothetical protein